MSCKICWRAVNDGRQKLLHDKYRQNNRTQEKFQKQTWLDEDKNEMSEFTPHIHTMYTRCATILAINSNRNSDWCYTKYAVKKKKKFEALDNKYA